MISNIKIISCFNIKDYDRYAKTFLESFIKYWDERIHLAMYYHDGELPEDIPKARNITYHNLSTDEDLKSFKERNKTRGGVAPDNSYHYQMDALKFSHKVFALTNEAYDLYQANEIPFNDFKTKYLIWLDADTITKKKVEPKDIHQFVQVEGSEPHIVHLGRSAIDYSETSFVSFDISSLRTLEFLNDYRGMYLSDELLGYREWHDGFIFTRLLNLHEMHGLVVHNMTPECKDLRAFASSGLAEYMVHLKGNLKDGPIIGPTRYLYLVAAIDFYRSKNILEVGTWNGNRAIEMAGAALKHSDVAHYTGFDLFEDATKETDKKEFNTKQHNSKENVEKKLAAFAAEVKEKGKTFTYCLIKGDTKETLKVIQNKDYCNTHNIKPDFAYIDGGHSVATCKSDYEYLKHVPVIVLDDYFIKDEQGRVPEPDQCGTNVVYDECINPSYRKKLLKSNDPVASGGTIYMGAILANESLPDFPDFHIEITENPTPQHASKMPIKVRPHDCVDDSYIKNNIIENRDKFKKSITKKYKINDGLIVVASAGPSLVDHLDDIKKEQEQGAKIVCVKHSLPVLMKNNIIPWGCIVLDPRPLDGVSTHGIPRQVLFQDISKDTKFFIATMTDPSVTDYIMSKTDNIYGWDAYSQAVHGWEELTNTMLITGGTCAATRAVGVCHVLGYRNFTLYGFDSCVYDLSDEDKKAKIDPKENHVPDDIMRPKYLNVGVEVSGNEEKFWTTGELLAMAQDIESMLDNKELDINLEMKCGGLVDALWRDRVSKGYRKEHVDNLLNG